MTSLLSAYIQAESDCSFSLLHLRVGEQSLARAALWKKREQKIGKPTDEKEAGKG
jgi:hypothetical protein